MYRFKSIIVIILLFTSCSKENKAKVIILQPLGNFSLSETKLLQAKIKEINPNVIIRKNIPFPAIAYYSPRNRYRANALINYLSKFTNGDTVVVGLSNLDISTTKGNIFDYGVMGLGYQPGNACVTSTFRLSKSKLSEQFYKVTIHELGHTQGLSHCEIETCYMRDANGGNPLNEETGFCNSCKKHLKSKGWNFN